MATRKKRTPVNPKAAAKPMQRLYPNGTPVDANGNLIDDAEVSEEVAREIGLDLESARENALFNDTLKRKVRKEHGVKWNDNDSDKFLMCFKLWPSAKVVIEQLEPVQDQSIDAKPLSMFHGEYSELLRYIKTHWDGQDAKYKWTCKSVQNPNGAVGYVHFKANPMHQRESSEDDMRQPPWGYPPPPGYYPPMPPQAPYGQVAGPPYVPPPAPPMPTPEVGGGDMLSQLMAVVRQNAELMEQLRQMKAAPAMPQPMVAGAPPPQTSPELQYMAQMVQWMLQREQQKIQEEIQRAQVPTPPAAPPDPIQQARQTLGMLSEVANLGRSFVQQQAAPEAETPPEPDDFPYKVKELPHIRMVATKDGQLVDATTNLMFNGDKVGSMIKSLFGEVRGMLKDREQIVDKGEQMRQKKLEDLREFAGLMERVKASQMASAVQAPLAPPAVAPPPVQVAPPAPPASPVQVAPPAPLPVQAAPPVPPAPLVVGSNGKSEQEHQEKEAESPPPAQPEQA